MAWCPFCEQEVPDWQWRQDGVHERKAFWRDPLGRPGALWVFVVCLASVRRGCWVDNQTHETSDDIVATRARLRAGQAAR